MIMHMNTRIAVVSGAVGCLVLLAACGRRSDSTSHTSTARAVSASTVAAPTAIPTTLAATATTSTTTTQDPAAAIAEITANWERFFLPTTSIADRVTLLENGTSLQQALAERAKDPLQQQASATVKKVELTSPTQAKVTYDISLNGTVALADSQGFAVVQDGVWKVGADSFCALISLGAAGPIPGCG